MECGKLVNVRLNFFTLLVPQKELGSTVRPSTVHSSTSSLKVPALFIIALFTFACNDNLFITL